MEIDPVSFTLDEMMHMDPLALHHLATKSMGTLTRYQALLGRLLLAIERTGAYKDYGCSGGVHYAVIQLGLPHRRARLLIYVARELEMLPYLRYLANQGEISWSKLREIVRVATPDTERDWAQSCENRTYAQIESMVARSARGEIPSDQKVFEGPRSELRCRLEPGQMAVVERAVQVMSQAAGRALSAAEAIVMALAEKLVGRPVAGEEDVAQVCQEAAKDLGWTDVIGADTDPTPDGSIRIVNPKSRVASRAQRRKILRRDGYCCQVPGCPNTIWLEVHHILFYADGGLTRPDNLITICSRCHQNVHDGHLIIQGNAPHGAIFLDRFGRDLQQERTLDVAFWLDIWCGWRGTEYDNRYLRARQAAASEAAARREAAA